MYIGIESVYVPYVYEYSKNSVYCFYKRYKEHKQRLLPKKVTSENGTDAQKIPNALFTTFRTRSNIGKLTSFVTRTKKGARNIYLRFRESLSHSAVDRPR